MVCPICGGKSEVGVFCSECYLKRNLKIELPGLIEVPHCKGCGAYLMGSKWLKGLSEEDAVIKSVENSLKTNIKGLDKAGALEIEASKTDKEYVAVTSILLGESETKKRAIVRIKRTACPDCSRIAGGYYEAVLQLRGGVSKKTVEDIVGSVEKHKDKFSFVSDVKKVQGGFDIYLGSKKSAEKIVKGFRGKAEMKKSFEQVSRDRQTSKTKKRFYYLIRL